MNKYYIETNVASIFLFVYFTHESIYTVTDPCYFNMVANKLLLQTKRFFYYEWLKIGKNMQYYITPFAEIWI